MIGKIFGWAIIITFIIFVIHMFYVNITEDGWLFIKSLLMTYGVMAIFIFGIYLVIRD
jgi:hypothetical protein